ADLATLHEWKADGRVLPTNPARMVDVDSAAVAGSAKEALWKTAGDIPGLFRAEAPPVQVEASNQKSAISNQKPASKPPSRNILVETFRIYFRGFFQFFCLSLLSIVPILCAELTSRFIDAAPGVNVDLRTLVAVAFGLCMFALGLLVFQLWLFGRFFINVLFWQQFTVLENATASDALRESRKLARSGRDLSWYQRPLWRGALIVSLWFAFALAITITPAWPMLRDYFVELMRTQDPQALYQKMNAALQT